MQSSVRVARWVPDLTCGPQWRPPASWQQRVLPLAPTHPSTSHQLRHSFLPKIPKGLGFKHRKVNLTSYLELRFRKS